MQTRRRRFARSSSKRRRTGAATSSPGKTGIGSCGFKSLGTAHANGRLAHGMEAARAKPHLPRRIKNR